MDFTTLEKANFHRKTTPGSSDTTRWPRWNIEG